MLKTAIQGNNCPELAYCDFHMLFIVQVASKNYALSVQGFSITTASRSDTLLYHITTFSRSEKNYGLPVYSR